ncbi:sigma-70 family RNA polymerase sigma factor [Saccharothrix xinjiangensis]|uniref:RNA polymerase sigma factor n=1 Tax=Saccharothrix xinjiangensis TaxID=204798 RepID=A0ABV9Y222_9PSEU
MIRIRPRHPDDHEFSAFYKANYNRLRSWVRATNPGSEYDQITDEAFTQMWRYWGRITVDRRAYLFTIARNELIQNQNRPSAMPVEPDDSHRLTTVPVEGVDDWQRWADVRDRIAGMPRHVREALSLKIYGLTRSEIARVMGCSPHSVSNYLWTAGRHLDGDAGATQFPDPGSGDVVDPNHGGGW